MTARDAEGDSNVDGLHGWWGRLTEPSPRLTDPGLRDRSHMLAGLLAFLFVWALAILLIVRYVMMPAMGWQNPQLLIGLLAAGVVGISFFINRKGYYGAAAGSLVGVLFATVIVACYLGLTGDSEPYFARDETHLLVYLVLPLVLAAALLPGTWFMLLLGLTVVAVLLVPLVFPHITWHAVLYGPGLFLAALCSLLLVLEALLNAARGSSYRQLAEREKRFRSLFEQSPDAVFLVASDGVIEQVNQAGLELFGYAPGELDGRHVREIYANPEERVPVVRRTQEQGSLKDLPVRLRKRDGAIMDCLITIWLRRDASGRLTGYQTTVRDVTERLKSDEELALKGQLLDLASDVILLVDPGGEIVYANDATAVLTGYSTSELAGMNIRQLNTSEGAEHVPSRISQMLRDGGMDFETVWVCKDGRRVEVEVRSRTIQSRGRTLFLSAGRDVTRRKADEVELRLRGELLDTAQDSVFLHDLKGKIVYANESAWRTRGYTREELLARNIRELDAPEDAARFNGRMAQLMAKHAITFEANHLCKDGTLLAVEVRSRELESGGAILVLSIARDIRERKKAEAALRESESRYRAIFEQSIDAIFENAPDGTEARGNQAWLDMFGYSLEELATLKAGDLYVDESDRERYVRAMRDVGFVRDEVHMRRKDGSGMLCQRVASVRRDVSGQVVAYQGIVRDITAQKKAERELRESEARYRALFEQSLDAIYVNAPGGESLSANQAWLDMFGYTRDELKSVSAVEIYSDPHEREWTLAKLEQDGFISDEIVYRRKDGSLFDCQRAIVAQRDDAGRIVSFQGVMRDVTEHKKAERGLRASEEKYRSLFEQSMDAVAIYAMDGTLLDANPAHLRLFGLTPEDIGQRSVLALYVNPEDRQEFLRLLGRDGLVVDQEVRLKSRDGRVMDCIRTAVARRDAGGRIVGAQTVTRDVTEQKRAELELRESEQRYRVIADDTIDVIWRMGLDMRFTYVNPAIEAMFGFAPKEWIGTSLAEHSPEAEFVKMRDIALAEISALGRYPEGHPGISFEAVMLHRNGSAFPVEIRAKILTDANGHPHTIHGITRDITERTQGERALRESEARFRALVEHTGLGMAITRTDGTILDCNDVLPQMLGYTRGEFLKLRMPDVYASQDDRERVLAQALQDGHVRDVEVVFRRKDGSSLFVSMTSSIVPMAGETVVVSQFLDISERKAAELELLRSREELQRSAEQLHELTTYLEEAREKERTGIARELHDQLGQALTALRMDVDGMHRVVDAGQGIPVAALDRMGALLDETVNDVRRISSELRPGILDDAGLVAAIEWQLDRFQERSEIACTLEAVASDSALSKARTTALFRVFQELLTNVARHSGATQVWVRFDRDNGNGVLSVADDGRGITEEQAENPTSLGIIGIRERLRPHGGRIEFLRRRPKGTTARVIVPLD